MRETEVLRLIRQTIADAGDDAALVPFRDTQLVLTTDMLHRTTDFPQAASPHTIGWRSVAVSLSDLAAMGASPLAVLLALGDPRLDEPLIRGILDGAVACCRSVGARLVGGDVDRHAELTLVSTAVGEAARPVGRGGAQVGDLVCVTGTLGRTQAALALFDAGEAAEGDELFCFPPRIAWGLRIALVATSLIDVSDGLAHSLHLLCGEGGVGCVIEAASLPILPALAEAVPASARREAILFGGEDYELLFTVPEPALPRLDGVPVTVIGRVTPEAVLLDGVELPDRGYEH